MKLNHHYDRAGNECRIPVRFESIEPVAITIRFVDTFNNWWRLAPGSQRATGAVARKRCPIRVLVDSDEPHLPG